MDWGLAGNVIYDGSLALSCGIALRFGGTDEKIGAAIAIAATALTGLVSILVQTVGSEARCGFFLVDLATLAAFDALMVRSTKFWPVWAVGIQLGAVALSIMMMVDPSLLLPFGMVQGKFAYPILLSLVLGSIGDQRQAEDGASLASTE